PHSTTNPPSFPTRRSSDLKDEFLQNELTILDHINAGAEVTFLKFASVRAGYAKGVVTAGLGIDLPFLELNASAGFGELSTVGDEDRKSTRLNSSHVKISYA